MAVFFAVEPCLPVATRSRAVGSEAPVGGVLSDISGTNARRDVDGLPETDSESAGDMEPMTGMRCTTRRTASKRRARRSAARTLGTPTLVLALALALAGCGTGATVRPVDGTLDPEAEEQRRGEYARHEEFRNQYGLARIKAHYAYARGATGEGVTLGIVDTGVDLDHPKFEGKLDVSHVGDYDPDFGTCDKVGPDGTCVSELGHGTFVAGIMAAARHRTSDTGAASESAIHGVAFDAGVISVAVWSHDLEEVIDEIVAEYPEDPTPEQIAELQARVLDVEAILERERERDTAIAFARLNGRVTAVNCSFGAPGNIEDFGARALRERFPNAIEAMAQADIAAGERTVYVWAAGNAHGELEPDGSPVSATSVEVLPGLPVRIPELRGHSLAVVATNPQGTIADFSNRCGIASEFCLAAPGVNITSTAPGFHCDPGTSQCYVTLEVAGTSSAAPFVTGGIGLLAQHFRDQLGNDEIVERILATADGTGVYADADVYGQGFLDLDAATRPVGQERMLTGVSLFGSSSPEEQSTLHLGPAFGDSLARGLASARVASFDELDAPFFRPLGDYLRPVGFAGRSLGERLRALGQDPRGTPWEVDGPGLQVRLDVVPAAHGGDVGDGPGSAFAEHALGGADVRGTGRWGSPAALASLSVMHDFGDGQLSLGYRSRLGSQFGLGGGELAPGTFTDADAFANPFLGFARNGASLGFASSLGTGSLRIAAFAARARPTSPHDAHGDGITGALTEYRFGGLADSGLSLQAGWMSEANGAVGSRPDGAFGEFRTGTLLTGLSASRRLSASWTVLGSAHAGVHRTDNRRQGIVRGVSGLWSSAFAVGVIGRNVARSGDRLAFRLAQPLRVEAGRAQLRWVSGRRPDGQVELEHADLSLESSGRQLDLEVAYSRPWAGGRVHMAAIASHDAGHVAGEREVSIVARYGRRF